MRRRRSGLRRRCRSSLRLRLRRGHRLARRFYMLWRSSGRCRPVFGRTLRLRLARWLGLSLMLLRSTRRLGTLRLRRRRVVFSRALRFGMLSLWCL
jgi:hypothetical protein